MALSPLISQLPPAAQLRSEGPRSVILVRTKLKAPRSILFWEAFLLLPLTSKSSAVGDNKEGRRGRNAMNRGKQRYGKKVCLDLCLLETVKVREKFYKGSPRSDPESLLSPSFPFFLQNTRSPLRPPGLSSRPCHAASLISHSRPQPNQTSWAFKIKTKAENSRFPHPFFVLSTDSSQQVLSCLDPNIYIILLSS